MVTLIVLCGQISNEVWELAGSFSRFVGKSRNKPGVLDPGETGMWASEEGAAVEKDECPALICLFFAWVSGKYQDWPFLGTSDKMLVVFCRVFWLLVLRKVLEVESIQ